eukprot:scaffold308846_cov19-Prasinocladus_malaysianus.AAC.1
MHMYYKSYLSGLLYGDTDLRHKTARRIKMADIANRNGLRVQSRGVVHTGTVLGSRTVPVRSPEPLRCRTRTKETCH